MHAAGRALARSDVQVRVAAALGRPDVPLVFASLPFIDPLQRRRGAGSAFSDEAATVARRASRAASLSLLFPVWSLFAAGRAQPTCAEDLLLNEERALEWISLSCLRIHAGVSVPLPSCDSPAWEPVPLRAALLEFPPAVLSALSFFFPSYHRSWFQLTGRLNDSAFVRELSFVAEGRRRNRWDSMHTALAACAEAIDFWGDSSLVAPKMKELFAFVGPICSSYECDLRSGEQWRFAAAIVHMVVRFPRELGDRFMGEICAKLPRDFAFGRLMVLLSVGACWEGVAAVADKFPKPRARLVAQQVTRSRWPSRAFALATKLKLLAEGGEADGVWERPLWCEDSPCGSGRRAEALRLYATRISPGLLRAPKTQRAAGILNYVVTQLFFSELATDGHSSEQAVAQVSSVVLSGHCVLPALPAELLCLIAQRTPLSPDAVAAFVRLGTVKWTAGAALASDPPVYEVMCSEFKAACSVSRHAPQLLALLFCEPLHASVAPEHVRRERALRCMAMCAVKGSVLGMVVLGSQMSRAVGGRWRWEAELPCAFENFVGTDAGAVVVRGAPATVGLRSDCASQEAHDEEKKARLSVLGAAFDDRGFDVGGSLVDALTVGFAVALSVRHKGEIVAETKSGGGVGFWGAVFNHVLPGRLHEAQLWRRHLLAAVQRVRALPPAAFPQAVRRALAAPFDPRPGGVDLLFPNPSPLPFRVHVGLLRPVWFASRLNAALAGFAP